MKRVLIIEDEVEIAALEQDYLKMSGFDAEIAVRGREGLEKALGGSFDLVVLDIMLPEMDGFEILRELRRKSDIPVILLSAKTADIDKIRGLGLGADDYMQKPFSPGELVARVGAHLSRFERLTSGARAQRAGRKIDVRGLSIDREDHRVFLHGQERQLTPKEFDLLLFMVENPNRVYSKEELFERVWGLEALGDSGTVVVHIKKLREKIESDPQNPQFIETVWGAGYRFKL